MPHNLFLHSTVYPVAKVRALLGTPDATTGIFSMTVLPGCIDGRMAVTQPIRAKGRKTCKRLADFHMVDEATEHTTYFEYITD